MSTDSLDRFAERKLAALERRRLRRTLTDSDRIGGVRISNRGAELISFACNDYLGLAHDPLTTEAAVAATTSFGAGAGAARLISGNHSLYRDLERRLARLKGTEDAVVFGSGYLANIGVIPVVAGSSDLIVIDDLAHSCLLAGAQLSGARTISFRHNDTDDLRRILSMQREKHRHCLIVTEGVFSMDGDLAPLPTLSAIAAEFDAWLLTDDAHGLGVVGDGRGSSFAHGDPVPVHLQVGTLSKAAGAYGGYVCATASVAELIRNRAASFVYSTGLPPGTIAAAVAALALIERDPERCRRAIDHARRFAGAFPLPAPESAIVPLITGSVETALSASDRLRSAGFFVPAIRPPTVPSGTARLRFTFSAAHKDSQIEALIDAVRSIGLKP